MPRADAGRMGETHDRAEALRLKLASSRDSRRRVPAELRQEAVAFTKAEHALGQRYKSIATALGVRAETWMRWCRRSGEPQFTRVVVEPAARPRLTVHGPAGTRSGNLHSSAGGRLAVVASPRDATAPPGLTSGVRIFWLCPRHQNADSSSSMSDKSEPFSCASRMSSFGKTVLAKKRAEATLPR